MKKANDKKSEEKIGGRMLEEKSGSYQLGTRTAFLNMYGLPLKCFGTRFRSCEWYFSGERGHERVTLLYFKARRKCTCLRIKNHSPDTSLLFVETSFNTGNNR